MILIFDAHQEGIDDSWLLVVVGHDAADEGGLGGHQHVDQVVQLVPEVGAHRLEVRHLGGRLRLHHHPLLAPPDDEVDDDDNHDDDDDLCPGGGKSSSSLVWPGWSA